MHHLIIKYILVFAFLFVPLFADQSDPIQSYIEINKNSNINYDLILILSSFFIFLLIILNYYLNRKIKYEIKKQTNIENYLQNLTDKTFDAIATIDEKGNVITWNRSCEKLFGYSYSDIKGKNLHRLIMPPQFTQNYEKGFKHFRHTGQGAFIGKVIEIDAIHKNGEKIPIELSINVIEYEKKWHALGIIRDLRETKKLKNKVNHMEQQKKEIDSILNGSTTMLVIHDAKEITRVNQSFLDFFDNYNSYTELKQEHKSLFERFEKMDQAEYINKEQIDGSSWLDYLSIHQEKEFKVVLKKENKNFHFKIHVKKITIQNQELYLIELIDITQLKMMESQSKQAAMGEMIGNIAHQWRQPLSVISSGATGLMVYKEYGTLTDELFVQTCESINENAQYLSKTIDDFRDFIKGDRKKVIFNLEDNIESFLHLVEGTIKKYDIHIIKDVQSDIMIESYPNELVQCFINIFNNGKDVLKNISEDRYFFITTKKENNSIVITFKDNGGGISNDILPNIFEPYFTTKHQSQGTGLGLSMSYNLITQGMNGTIEANNINFQYKDQAYLGAIFTITLPL